MPESLKSRRSPSATPPEIPNAKNACVAGNARKAGDTVCHTDLPRIIAIANQEGGTAKTTTAAALAVLLARGGTPTHLIDMDPQASLTRAFGLDDETDGLYRSLTDRARLPVRTVSQNLTITPSTIELGRAETELLSEMGRELFLRASLEKTALLSGTIVVIDAHRHWGAFGELPHRGRRHDRRDPARRFRTPRPGALAC